jgi:hypothetical protein
MSAGQNSDGKNVETYRRRATEDGETIEQARAAVPLAPLNMADGTKPPEPNPAPAPPNPNPGA